MSFMTVTSGADFDERAALNFGTALGFERDQSRIPVAEEIVPVRNAQAVLCRFNLPFHGADDAPLVAVEEHNLSCFAARRLLQEKLDGVLNLLGRSRRDKNTGRVLDEDLKAAGTSSAAREDRVGFKR